MGSKLNKIILENGVWAWANIPARYVKESVEIIEKYLAKLADARWQLPKNKVENPFVRYYAPEMDETSALDQELASCYHYFIVMLRWLVEIGRVDITTVVSMMAYQMDMSRKGHSEAVLNVFAFLRQRYNSRMVFDPTYPAINISDFKEWKCKDFYGELK